MDVDDSAARVDASSDVPQPARRARRTYGKAKPLTSNEEENKSSDIHLSYQIPAHTGPSRAGISSLKLGDWKDKLAELDKSSDEEEENPRRPEPLVLNEVKDSGAESSLPSPAAASHSQHSQAHSTSPSRSVTNVVEPQYSADTSIYSGTTGAASSPPTAPPNGPPTVSNHALKDSRRPGPPAHADSFLSEDEESGASSELDLPILRRARDNARASTPEAQKSNESRLLKPSPFRSPVKSFSGATSSLHARRSHKYLGADSDDDKDIEMDDYTRPNASVTAPEDELGWVTDGSTKGDKGRGRRAKGGVKQPTKKDIVEAAKETARIRAERDLDVQDKARYAPMSFSTYFQKRAEKLPSNPLQAAVPVVPMPLRNDSGRRNPLTSDPISDFSSPHNALALNATKAKILAHSRLQLEESDDSDLEIVPDEAAAPTNPIQKLENVMRKAKKGPSATRPKPTLRTGIGAGSVHQEKRRQDHNKEILHQVSAQNQKLTAFKVEDFEKRGGIRTKALKSAQPENTLVQLLHQGASRTLEPEGKQPGEEDEDEDDPDYRPQDENAAPTSPLVDPEASVPIEGSNTFTSELDEDDEAMEHTDARTEPMGSEPDSDDNDLPRAVGKATKHVHVILSDEEAEASNESDAENFPPLTNSAMSRSSAVPRFDLSRSLSEFTRTPLGDLGSDDKGSSLFDRLDVSPSPAFAPGQRNLRLSSRSVDSSPIRGGGGLLPAFVDSPTTKAPSQKSTSPFVFSTLFPGGEEEDHDRSPTKSTKSTKSTRSTRSSIGFRVPNYGELNSQLFFTQASPSQRASPSKRNRASLDKKDPLGALRKPMDDDFLFSQPGGLGQIVLSTQEQREIRELEQADADAVLQDGEEERRRRLQEAQADNEPRWINEKGLFTQTKPTELPWSLTQNLMSQGTPFFMRSGELTAEQLLSQRSPAKTPARPRRLIKKAEVLSPETHSSDEGEDSSPLQERNAFTELMKPKKKPLPTNEFIEGEAEESDDELAMGFKRTQYDEDAEEANIDPEEMAKMLDDKKMTEAELREKEVIEKHKEQLAADDAERQRLAEKITKGQLRKKRDHDMINDSSSDDDERARPQRFKKRRVKGFDHLDDIAANEETKAFFSAYTKDLPGVEGSAPDEDDEFAQTRVPQDTVTTGGDDTDAVSDEEMSIASQEDQPQPFGAVRRDSEWEEDEQQGLVDPDAFLRAHLPSTDGPAEDEYERINHLPHPRVLAKGPPKSQNAVFVPRAGVKTVHDAARLAEWAKQNEKSRDGNVRGTGTAAVTGHGKNIARTKSVGTSTLSGSLQRAGRAATVSSLSRMQKKKGWEE